MSARTAFPVWHCDQCGEIITNRNHAVVGDKRLCTKCQLAHLMPASVDKKRSESEYDPKDDFSSWLRRVRGDLGLS